jgi:hypothetical protein
MEILPCDMIKNTLKFTDISLYFNVGPLGSNSAEPRHRAQEDVQQQLTASNVPSFSSDSVQLSTCNCKLHLGFNSFTTTTTVPDKDPLFEKLKVIFSFVMYVDISAITFG